MLHSLDKTITKVAINMQQKYLHHDNPLESKASSQQSSSQLIRRPCLKYAGLFIRNTIRNVLRKYFRRMLSRLIMRRVCWRLTKSIRRRDMERAFLSLRNHTNKLALSTLQKFYQRMPQLKIIVSICTRIFSKPERSAISLIRTHSLRRTRVRAFVSTLYAKVSKGNFRQAVRKFLSILVIERTRSKQCELGAEAIFLWAKCRHVSFLREYLNRIVDWMLMSSCNREVQQWRSKKQKVADSAQNRKKKLAKLRQDIKVTKADYEQQKSSRYKIFQEHKKAAHANKAQMTEMVRQFEKEKKVEEAAFNQIKNNLKEWQRLLDARKCYSSRINDSEPVDVCFEAYRALGQKESQFRGIQHVLPDVRKDLLSFKGSQNYYFLSNLQMSKLVEVYEKRQPYNYEAEYYQLQYQNRVVRQTMRCFVRQKYEAYVSRVRWGHSSKSPSLMFPELQKQIQ